MYIMKSLKALGMKVAVPMLGLIGYASATCESTNVTCQLQPVLDLLDFMPLVIEKISPIVIPLVIVIVVATVIIAVGSIPVAIVLLIGSLTKNLTGRLHMGGSK